MVGWWNATRLVSVSCLGGLLWAAVAVTVTDVEPTLVDGLVMVVAGALLLAALGAASGWPFVGKVAATRSDAPTRDERTSQR